MNYSWISERFIECAKYPNLIAEIKESGYSICTISESMGHGQCKESDTVIWSKLNGEMEITAGEAMGLAKIFNVKAEYLFADKLAIVDGKSYAYWRWYEYNKKLQEKLEQGRAAFEIYDELKNNACLLEFIKVCIRLTDTQRQQVLQLINE